MKKLMPPTVSRLPASHRPLSTEARLARDRENDCRYRQGKWARKPVVVRQPTSDDEEYSDGTGNLTQTRCGVNGRMRDYELTSNTDVYDEERWLSDEVELVERTMRLAS